MNRRATIPERTKDHSSTVSPSSEAIGAPPAINTLAESGTCSMMSW